MKYTIKVYYKDTLCNNFSTSNKHLALRLYRKYCKKYINDDNYIVSLNLGSK